MEKQNLNGKNVLLIVPVYFGYDQQIRDALEKEGARVTIVYENIKEINFGYRFIFVYMKRFQKQVTYHYYKKRIQAAGGKIDLVLVIRGSSITEEIMALIKERASADCRYIMYQWDSIKNNMDVMPIMHHFDSISTFDVKDAEVYGWKYRPLFFLDSLAKQDTQRDTDIAYVCTIHSKRIQLYLNLKQICEKQKFKLHAHIFIKWLLFFKYKYLDKNPVIVDAGRKDLQFHSLSLEETYALYQRSKIVVDYTHPGQTGFTMRTIEALGNGCKLITNNPLVKQADFYNEKNILVYEDTDICVPEEFANTPYEKLEEQVYRKYSLTEWIEELMQV